MTTPISNYDLVEKYFENSGIACWNCPNFDSWTEPHGERLSECQALTQDEPEDCPELENLINKAATLSRGDE